LNAFLLFLLRMRARVGGLKGTLGARNGAAEDFLPLESRERGRKALQAAQLPVLDSRVGEREPFFFPFPTATTTTLVSSPSFSLSSLPPTHHPPSTCPTHLPHLRSSPASTPRARPRPSSPTSSAASATTTRSPWSGRPRPSGGPRSTRCRRCARRRTRRRRTTRCARGCRPTRRPRARTRRSASGQSPRRPATQRSSSRAGSQTSGRS